MLRLDDLYEMYVLHQLLLWLLRAGFVLRDGSAHPVEMGCYTVDDPRYRPCTAVAGVYRLARGDQHVTPYFQPVIHGTEREEMGVTLHRTTVHMWGGGRRGDRYPFYTPDYLLEVEGPTGREVYILDAKFSGRYSLLSAEGHVGEERFDRGASSFQAVMLKYLLEVIDARTGRSANAVWLLCSDVRHDLWKYQSSPWVQAREGFKYSGIAGVAPSANDLDELFAEMGIDVGRPWTPSRVERTAAGEHREECVPVDVQPVGARPAPTQLEVEAPLQEGTTRGSVRDEGDKPEAAKSGFFVVELQASGPKANDSERVEPENSEAEASIPKENKLGTYKPKEPEPGAAERKEGKPKTVIIQGTGAKEVKSAAAEIKKSAVHADPSSLARDVAPAKQEEPAKSQGATKKVKSAVPAEPAKSTKKSVSKDSKLAVAPVSRSVTVNQVVALLELVPSKERLSDAKHVRSDFGLSCLLVREKPATGAEAKAYALTQLDGRHVYVRTRLTPVEFKKLEAAVRRLVPQDAVASMSAQSFAAGRIALAAVPAKTEERGDRAAAKRSGKKGKGDSKTKPVDNGKPKPRDGRGGVNDEVAGLIRQVWPHLVEKDILFGQISCQKNFGLNAPLLKRRLGPKDAKTYVSLEVEGEQLYVYARLNPVHLARLRKGVEKTVRESEALAAAFLV